MNWRLKVAGFKALSSLPGGTAFYRFAQKNLTGSLRPTIERVSHKMAIGLQYLDWLDEHKAGAQLLGGHHLDFGAGWHPTIPLLYYSLGVERQHLFDVSALLDESLVELTVEMFLSIVNNPQWPHRSRLRRLPPPLAGTNWARYLTGLGISYHAPYDGAWSPLAGGVDVVTSTQVLLHIPKPTLATSFSKIYSALKPGGFFLATIHLRDLLTTVQPGVSKYNHFRYSTETWERWVNSHLMSYSRLRASDYKQLLEQAGFNVVGFEIESGTAEDLAELDRIPLAPCFQRYSREDLAAKHLFFAAKKK